MEKKIKVLNSYKAVFPSMELYEEIIFMENHCKTKYVIENVKPYYKPLIAAQKRHRHLYWSNFKLPGVLTKRKVKIGKGLDEVNKLCEFHDYDFNKYNGKQRKDKIARNLVDYEAGKTIFQEAVRLIQNKPQKQIGLFEVLD